MKRMYCFVVVIVYCWALGACGINKQMPLWKVARQLEGNWVNQEYLEVLSLTQSPQQADEATRIKIIQIEIDSFKELILSFEAGDDWILSQKKEGWFFSSIFDHKLHLEAKFISKQKLQIGTKSFLRFREALNIEDKDVLFIQKTLFTGCYDWNGTVVEFYGDGTIKGMEQMGVRSYYPIADYNNQEIDQIWVNKEQESSVKYGFEFQKKKLSIYQLKCPNQEVFCGNKNQKGKILFEMHKQ